MKKSKEIYKTLYKGYTIEFQLPENYKCTELNLKSNSLKGIKMSITNKIKREE